MTKSNDAPPQQGHGLDGFYATLRRPGIVRGSDGRWFAGVSTGIARWLGVDPLVVRAGFILFSIFFGMGVSLYLVLWLLMPDERGEIHVERALKHGEGHSIFLLVVTAIALLGGGPWWGGDMHGFRIGGFVLLVIGAWWFLTRTDTGRDLSASAPWKNGGRPAGGPPTGRPHAETASSAAGGATPPVGTAPGGPAGSPTGSSTGSSTGNAAANAGMTLAQRPAPAPVPAPRPRTRSVGFAAGMLALGTALVTGALLTELARSNDWSGNALAIGIAGGLAVIGLTMVVAGLAGRRSGGLAMFAWIGMFAAVFTTAAPANLTQPWTVGERGHVPAAASENLDYQLGLGEMRVDLRSLTGSELAKTPAVDTVRATVGIGELTVFVPDGVSVEVHAKGRAGQVVATGSNEPNDGSLSGVGPVPTGPAGIFRQEGTSWNEKVTYGQGPTALVVEAEVGLGEIRILPAAP